MSKSRSLISKRRSHKTPLGYSTLETRNLLAATITLNGTELTIEGTSLNDVVEVNQAADDFEVAVTGGATETYLNSQVTSIVFNGYAGNDSFTNNSSIPLNANGHAGFDTLIGGSANDILQGGLGQDQLVGNAGDDEIYGYHDNDVIDAGDGNDFVRAGSGEDVIYGGDGDDYLDAQWSNDTVYGGNGNDEILGSGSNDTLYGGEGDDTIWGMDGWDIIHGENGADFLAGGANSDWIYGGSGNDFVWGGSGDDHVWGTGGVDNLHGADGNDEIFGGWDNDYIYGTGDDDTLYGGQGNDVIQGDQGDDYVYGEDGNDNLSGGDGADNLEGADGIDTLTGGDGNDILNAGLNAGADSLTGGNGLDRFLVRSSFVVSDVTSDDARLVFEDVSSTWTSGEIAVVNQAFDQLFAATGNNRLLQDSVPSGDLTFYKYDDLNGSAGINYIQWTSSYNWNGQEWVETREYTREIQILDWDETSTFYNNFFQSTIIHELAHNWDDDFELAEVGLSQLWTDFLNIGGWTEVDPNSSDYTLSLDGQWWYLNSSSFAENYGRTNPNEDMATIWEHYFNEGMTGDTGLLAKLDIVDQVIQSISS